MSDASSDEDDDLLMIGSGLASARKDKVAERKKKRQNSFLESAILDSQRMVNEQNRISALQKKQKHSYEELKISSKEFASQMKEDEAQQKEDQANQVDGWDISLQDAVLDEARRVILVQATHTSQSTGFGLRSIISFHPPQHSTATTTNIPFAFYSSKQNALQSLEGLLQLHRPQDPDHDCPALTSEHDCPALNMALITALEHSLLDRLFEIPTSLVTKLRNERATTLRPDLFHWLLGVVASAAQMDNQRELVHGVAENLESLVQQGFCPPSARTMTLQQLANILSLWIPEKASLPHSSPNDKTTQEANQNNKNNSSSSNSNNIAGLVHFLRYFTALITKSCWEPPTCTLAEVTACLQRFCWMSLDYATELPDSARGIRVLLRGIIPDFLRIVSSKVTDDETDLSFLDSCVKDILDPLSTLGPGRKDSDDKEDTKAHLCHSVIVQAIPVLHHKTQKPHALSIHFRATMAIGALDRLSKGEISKMAINQISSESIIPTINKYIQMSLGGFAFLDSLGMDIIEDAPLAPAVAECSKKLFECACLLLSLEKKNNLEQKSEAVAAQATTFANIVAQLDGYASQTSKRTRGMCTNPHMRRVECLLNALNQYVRYAQAKARAAAGEGEKVHEQTKMDQFFKSEANTRKDMDSDTDSDEGDE